MLIALVINICFKTKEQHQERTALATKRTTYTGHFHMVEFNSVYELSSLEEPRGREGNSLQADAQVHHADNNRVA